MRVRSSFEYALVRVVPRVEREEFLNVGVILHCPAEDFLGAVIALDAARLAAIAPGLDLELVGEYLHNIPLVCRGGPDAGPIGALPPRGRFHWLTSPRSTVVQPSPVHSGLCLDPADMLERLMRTGVRLGR